MNEWRETTLGQFVSLQRGHDLPSDKRTAGLVPVMGSFGITGWHNEARAPGPGVTVGRSGASIGVVSYIERDYWPLNTCLFAINFHGNNPRFVYYFMRTLDLAAHNSGSAQPSLNRNYISPIKISVPGRETQDNIVNLVGALDDKIQLNRRMNETLEAMAQSISRDWFVDFGPTRRKLEGATDPVTIMGGLVQDIERAQAIADLFPATLGDDGLPEGWAQKQVGEVVVLLKRGLAPSYTEDGILVINQKCVRNKAVNFEAARRHDAEKRPPKDRLLEEYDVVVNSTGVGTLGRVATVRGLKEEATADSHVTICRADTSKVSKLILSLFLEGQEALIETMGHGSTGQTELSPASLSALALTVAPKPVQLAFDNLVMPLRNLVTSYSEGSLTLAETRDLLLPKLMSGEIRLGEAVEAVA